MPPLLDRIDAAAPVDAIDVAEAELAARVGARSVSLLVADYSGRAIVRLDTSTWGRHAGQPRVVELADTIELAGTVYERVLRTQEVDVAGSLLTVPVTVRGDPIGVVEVDLPSPPDAGVLAEVGAVALALGYVVVANRRYTDLFEWGQRTQPFSLAAEIQRRLLPGALSCEAEQFSLAGWLEPANTVGGDTFDYALDRHTLHLSITDAVGNDVNAAMLATVLVSGLRNGRRRRLGLEDQVRSANDALARHSPVGQFVTGQVVRIDLLTGEVIMVNAGHPFPLRLRDGRIDEIELAIDIPFGLYEGREFRLQRFSLEPGDRVVFLTDGVLDRNSDQVDAPAALLTTVGLHPREVVHVLSDAVVAATGGNLKDDSTVLCLDWHGVITMGERTNGTRHSA
jgi:serine phosphatase RsbU (regulator of sigma subunit)